MRQRLMAWSVTLARWMAEIMVSGMPLFLLACQVSFFIPQKSVKNHFLCRRIIEQLRRLLLMCITENRAHVVTLSVEHSTDQHPIRLHLVECPIELERHKAEAGEQALIIQRSAGLWKVLFRRNLIYQIVDVCHCNFFTGRSFKTSAHTRLRSRMAIGENSILICVCCGSTPGHQPRTPSLLPLPSGCPY